MLEWDFCSLTSEGNEGVILGEVLFRQNYQMWVEGRTWMKGAFIWKKFFKFVLCLCFFIFVFILFLFFLCFYAIIIATTFSVLYSTCPALVMSCVSPANYRPRNVRCHICFCAESSVITARFLVEREIAFSYITKCSFLWKVKNELFEPFL